MGRIRRLLAGRVRVRARWLLGIPVRDLTGGFDASGEVLETIDLEAVHADGYSFQIELTYRAVQAGFTVRCRSCSASGASAAPR